ncbi:MAG: spore coat protein U domain-containing protein [Novosphingobium sp.]|nr:spore coat protein U domain-containing protein [Novosphingobium sp.]
MSNDELVRLSVPAPAAGGAAKKRPSGLGRGLGALMGEARGEEPLAQPGPAGGAPARAGAALTSIATAQIEAHPSQPRRRFDEAALDELAQSIAQRGVIQPVIVRPLGPDSSGSARYQLVAGERRWRAAQKAQLHEIPAIVRELDEREVTALALIENLQREDLNPIEEASAYQRLSEEQGLSQADLARMVDKSRSHVANLMRLLVLPREVQAMVEDGRLQMGHARALIGTPDPVALAHDVVARGLSARATERLARKAARGEAAVARRARDTRDPAQNADIAAVQRHLEDFLGLKVGIVADADPRSGAVTIRYRTLDQLDLICQANVLNNCTVQAQPLAFGTVPAVNLTPLETTARVVVNCGPNIPFTVAFDNGQHFAAQRRVHNAGMNAYLEYEVHSDPARTSPWGSGAGQIVSGNSGASGEATLIAYGRITAALLVFVGPYTDSIAVTVSF